MMGLLLKSTDVAQMVHTTHVLCCMVQLVERLKRLDTNAFTLIRAKMSRELRLKRLTGFAKDGLVGYDGQENAMLILHKNKV